MELEPTAILSGVGELIRTARYLRRFAEAPPILVPVQQRRRRHRPEQLQCAAIRSGWSRMLFRFATGPDFGTPECPLPGGNFVQLEDRRGPAAAYPGPRSRDSRPVTAAGLSPDGDARRLSVERYNSDSRTVFFSSRPKSAEPPRINRPTSCQLAIRAIANVPMLKRRTTQEAIPRVNEACQ